MKKLRFRPWVYVAMSVAVGVGVGYVVYPYTAGVGAVFTLIGLAKIYDEYKKEVVDTKRELQGRIVKR